MKNSIFPLKKKKRETDTPKLSTKECHFGKTNDNLLCIKTATKKLELSHQQNQTETLVLQNGK